MWTPGDTLSGSRFGLSPPLVLTLESTRPSVTQPRLVNRETALTAPLRVGVAMGPSNSQSVSATFALQARPAGAHTNDSSRCDAELGHVRTPHVARSLLAFAASAIFHLTEHNPRHDVFRHTRNHTTYCNTACTHCPSLLSRTPKASRSVITPRQDPTGASRLRGTVSGTRPAPCVVSHPA